MLLELGIALRLALAGVAGEKIGTQFQLDGGTEQLLGIIRRTSFRGKGPQSRGQSQQITQLLNRVTHDRRNAKAGPLVPGKKGFWLGKRYRHFLRTPPEVACAAKGKWSFEIKAIQGSVPGVIDRSPALSRILSLLIATLAATFATAMPVQAQAALGDGSHDFDFEIGTWKTDLKRLLHPLSGSKDWAAYEGVTQVRKIWNGRANLVELEVDGPAGHFEGLNLRLYNPQSHQWSLNFAGRAGVLTAPTVGQFVNGRGEFYDQETFDGRVILVRFVISDITANSCHFEQAFSDDGGKHWEVNWIATDTRVSQ